ncbi:hypothetical protein DIPPA_20791 [Diplonema papillatum]|nr:hypothetical protein DIPPA_20791 [Diplonema papillatum]
MQRTAENLAGMTPDAIRDEMTELHAYIADLESEVDEMQLLREEVPALRAELQRADEQLQEARQRQAAPSLNKQREDELLKQLRTFQTEKEASEAAFAELNELLAEEKERTAAAKAAGHAEGGAELKEKERMVADLADAVSRLNAELAREKKAATVTVDALHATEMRLTAANTRISEFEITAHSGTDKLRADAAAAVRQQAFLQEQVKKSQARVDSLGVELEAISGQLDVEREKSVAQAAAAARVEVRLREKTAEVQVLNDKLAAKEAERAEIESFLASGNAQSQKETLRLKRELDAKTDTAARLAGDLEAATIRVEALSKELADKNKLLNTAEGMADHLRADFQVVKQHTAQRERKKSTHAAELIDEVRIAREHYAEEADKLRKAAAEAEEQLLTERRENTDKQQALHAEIDSLRSDLQRFELDSTTIQREKSHHSAVLEEKVQKLRADNERLSEANSLLEAQATALRLQVNDVEMAARLEKGTLESQISGLQIKLEGAEADCSNLQLTRGDAETRHAAECEALTKALADAKWQAAEDLAAGLRKASEQEESWRATLHKSEMQLAVAVGEKDAEIRALRLQVTEHDFAASDNSDAVARLREELDSGKQDRLHLQEEVDALHLQLRLLDSQQRDELHAAAAQLDDLKEDAARRERDHRAALDKSYKREQETKQALAAAVKEAHDLKKEAKSLRQRVERNDERQQVAAVTAELERLKDLRRDELTASQKEVLMQESALRMQVESLKAELQRHQEAGIKERATLQEQHRQEIEEARRDNRRAEEAGVSKGRAQADRLAGEKIRHLQSTVDTLKQEQQQARRQAKAAAEAHEAAVEMWRETIGKEKQAASARLAAQQAESKAASDRLSNQLRLFSEAAVDDKRTLEHVQLQLAQVKQEAATAKAEMSLQLKQAEIRIVDQDKWRLEQINEEKNRHEKAQQDAKDARKELARIGKSMSDAESRLASKCTRLEREVASAQRDAASASARAEGLTIQLEERDRALKTAGQRLAAVNSERMNSPSPRRSAASVDDSAFAHQLHKHASRAASVEKDLETERRHHRDKAAKLDQLQAQLADARREAADAEEKAHRLADTYEKLEKEFRGVSADVACLKNEALVATRALAEAKSVHQATVDKLKTELQDARNEHEVHARRTQAEADGLRQQQKRTEDEVAALAERLRGLRDEHQAELRKAAEKNRDAAALAERRAADAHELEAAAARMQDRAKRVDEASGGLRRELDKVRAQLSQANRDLSAAKDQTRRSASEAESLKGVPFFILPLLFVPGAPDPASYEGPNKRSTSQLLPTFSFTLHQIGVTASFGSRCLTSAC